MAKMSKSKARLRIGEARRKLQKVMFDCNDLTSSQYRKLQKIYDDLLAITSKMM